MARWPKSTTIVVTADTLVTSHPCWLHGISATMSAGGGDVTIYEGQDTTSGRQLDYLEGANNITNSLTYNPPVWCERGLYVDVGSSVSSVTVHYTPQPLNPKQGE